MAYDQWRQIWLQMWHDIGHWREYWAEVRKAAFNVHCKLLSVKDGWLVYVNKDEEVVEWIKKL